MLKLLVRASEANFQKYFPVFRGASIAATPVALRRLLLLFSFAPLRLLVAVCVASREPSPLGHLKFFSRPSDIAEYVVFIMKYGIVYTNNKDMPV